MFTTIEKVIFLQNVDVFSQVPTEQLTYLAAIAEEITVLKDEVVYNQNDPSDALYLILDGSIRLHRKGQEITTAGSKDAFGTWALFDEEPRVATATAIEDTRLLRIDHDDFYELLADNVEITRAVLRTMVRRLRGLIERVRVEPPQGTS
ncbi:MAG: cyclic nucleotide-binding domain-containing protein [Candidatus Latescibacteria bacterium]|nr:cyclic nucleotide-binding domain-containing protein [Candidatus Latescibacterota bacterium]NIO00974.1 cyclic nucleotide-binding domain-containing protein [Candidatus Latescibacterota bacterium]NIO27373.1 cyclic nucleotide-binding domain-containing protein [Candidatus Latescibacterota bacterium]NIO54895.1 cyclic nucleotide-binding domain-containing protein [Candidatus Latescibacterota bacterium]NIT00984.1 cyclic nucleotide-binding domain-containing protein [Candidatus Latescibacterota bacteri